MVTYAQTNGTTIAATNLNNAFREEVNNAATAWSAKYKHLWRFTMLANYFSSSTPTVRNRRYFYAPDDMFLVGLAARVYNNSGSARTFTVKLVGDTESVAGGKSYIEMSQSVSSSSSPQDMTRSSFDASTDEKLFVRKGALYYLEVTAASGTNLQAFATATFALAKRST